MARLYQSHPLEGIADRRALLKIRAADIAASLGVATASYRRLERGERRCYLDKALAIADLLDCNVEQLGVVPDAEERIRLFGVSESRRAQLGLTAVWSDAEDASEEDEHIIVNRKAPGRKLVTLPPIEPLTPLTVVPVAVTYIAGDPLDPIELAPAEQLQSIIGDWLNDDDAPDTLVLPDAPEENGLVDLPHQGITPIHAAEDDEPDLPADPMAKYVTQWKGEQ